MLGFFMIQRCSYQAYKPLSPSPFYRVLSAYTDLNILHKTNPSISTEIFWLTKWSQQFEKNYIHAFSVFCRQLFTPNSTTYQSLDLFFYSERPIMYSILDTFYIQPWTENNRLKSILYSRFTKPLIKDYIYSLFINFYII